MAEDVKKVGFLPASVEREIVFSNKGNSAIMWTHRGEHYIRCEITPTILGGEQ
ncbi:MAG: hypothetical protein ACLUD0_20070 [Eubacterium ramulus]